VFWFVFLGGGKDFFAMVNILRLLQLCTNDKFVLHVFIVDKGLPRWNEEEIRLWLEANKFEFTVLKTNIFNMVKTKERHKDACCVLCSRLRCGCIYTFAKKHSYNKIALGHLAMI
jgi:tRNA 2-thiocytidine biosynthesis protein TtcA